MIRNSLQTYRQATIRISQKNHNSSQGSCKKRKKHRAVEGTLKNQTSFEVRLKITSHLRIQAAILRAYF